MFVNFNTIFLFHAVAFHVSMAYVFAHGWNWEYISTATITHAVIKFTAELATLHFRNLSKENNSDWAVMAAQASPSASVPSSTVSSTSATTKAGRRISRRSHWCTPSPSPASPRRRCDASPTWGALNSLQCLSASASSTRCSGSWLCPSAYLRSLPARHASARAVMALQHPDLCWNKESDEYTSCINLEGDALMNALRFTPKKEYFLLEKKDEEDYEDFEDAWEYEPIDIMSESGSEDVDKVVRGGGGSKSSRRPKRLKARRRSLLAGGNARLGGGNAYAPVAGGGVVKYSWENPTPVEDVRASETEVWRVPRAVAADMAYRGHASVSYEAMRNCNVAYGGEGWGGSSCEAFPMLPRLTSRRNSSFPRWDTSARRLKVKSRRRTMTFTRRWS